MAKKTAVLVVGSHQGALIQALDRMSLNPIACKTLKQAQEIMCSGEIQLIFCDEILPDGSFREMVASTSLMADKPRVVVIFRVGEWAEYLEALKLGAFEVIPCPVRAMDVESAVIKGFQGVNILPSPPAFQRLSA